MFETYHSSSSKDAETASKAVTWTEIAEYFLIPEINFHQPMDCYQ
jgi:hypothetical protein